MNAILIQAAKNQIKEIVELSKETKFHSGGCYLAFYEGENGYGAHICKRDNDTRKPELAFGNRPVTTERAMQMIIEAENDFLFSEKHN